MIETTWPAQQRERLAELLAAEADDPSTTWVGYWCSDQWGRPGKCSDQWGRPANGDARLDAVYPGLVQSMEGTLSPGLQATREPHRWRGCRVWVVALLGMRIDSRAVSSALRREVSSALRREIVGEVLPDECLSPQCAVRIAPNLGGADLRGADLRGTILDDANLRGAHMDDAKLRGATLSSTMLGGAHLCGADLREADLSYAQLDGANLLEADLEGAVLFEAGMRGVSMSEAHMDHAELANAVLWGADLSSADLHAVDVAGAELRGASLRDANLQCVRLDECEDLDVVDLDGVHLGHACRTSLPLRWEVRDGIVRLKLPPLVDF